MKRLLLVLCSFIIAGSLIAQVRLPGILKDSMILQRDQPVKIWGLATPGEKITISFQKRRYRTRASNAGNWQIVLPATPAGGPYEIGIRASNQITLKDVLFGDVFLCSGQSNMVHQMNIHDVTYAPDIASANYPQIRQFLVPYATSLTGPDSNINAGHWQPAVGESVRPFSAVAFFFAQSLYQRYNVPIGIINASVGGSPIQSWISEEALQSFPEIHLLLTKNKDTASIYQYNRNVTDQRLAQPLAADKGMLDEIKWFDPGYHPVGWRPIMVPGYWEDQGLAGLDGIIWFRKEIDVPASIAKNASRIFLGRIVDADELYINGQKIAETSYQYPQRRYHIPAGTLKPGKNMLTIRVTNYQGKGGFVPDKPYLLFSGKDSIGLKGVWQYKCGAVFDPNRAMPVPISIQNQPSALFNGMIAALNNYAIRGICWYQGEADTFQPKIYADLQKTQIRDWRRHWQNPELPFILVQLPGFMDFQYWPAESNWAALRESQATALQLPNTGMAIAIDLGEWNDIHPDNKKDVGVRLAKVARSIVYHEKINYRGPVMQSVQENGRELVVEFSNCEGGLISSDGQPPGSFAIAGIDKKFRPAQTRIEGNKVILWHDQILSPKFVRYAWADNPPLPNLYNLDRLPAEPFRNDR